LLPLNRCALQKGVLPHCFRLVGVNDPSGPIARCRSCGGIGNEDLTERRQELGYYFYNGGQVSPTVRANTSRISRSSRRKPVLTSACMISAAEGMTSRCLASSTRANVPLRGMEKARAHLRASASSRMAVHPF
jgi:hypothetical protein